MNEALKTKPEWTPPGSPVEPAIVQRGEYVEKFLLVVPKPEQLVEFTQELNRAIKMTQVLYRALRSFEDGDVRNYADAAANVAKLTKEIDKAEIALRSVYTVFWKFTELSGDPDRIRYVEQMFAGHGDEMISFIIACCNVFVLTEDERKNSSRGRTESSPQERPPTAQRAKPSSTDQTGSPSVPVSSEKK